MTGQVYRISFHCLNKTLDLERTIKGLKKPLRKKSYQKLKEKQNRRISACELKNHNRESASLVQTPFSNSL